MPWHITDQIDDYDSYERAREAFEWTIPDDYNIARDVVGKHKDSENSVALYGAYPDGRRETYTFQYLDVRSAQLANALESVGVEYGDRVSVVAPQKVETAVTYLACWKMGAIPVPISMLYGVDGIEYRLRDSDAAVVIADAAVSEKIESVVPNCSNVTDVIYVDPAEQSLPSFDEVVEPHSGSYDLADTDGDTTAMIQYTSGTTGPPKGVVLTHSVVPGFIPGFYMMFDRRLPDEATIWAPADWAWITGPFFFASSWHFGRPIVGCPMGPFDTDQAFGLMEEFDVTLGLFPPTALRMMSTVSNPTERYNLSLEVLCGSGEPITGDIYEWVDTAFDDVILTEAYGQTEADPIVADCPDWFDVRQGSMGKPILGHDVAVIDTETGELLPAGEVGEVAVRHEGNPVIMTEYWNQPEKTADSFLDGWYLTGDLATVDEDGYFWYKGRVDDIIITSGYRVGPDEVENAILDHPDVEQVGVIGIPDDTRGEIIKAFVQPVPWFEGDDDLRDEITSMVKENLAKYQYPREIDFVDELPMTTTGKIRRTDLRERENAPE